MIRSLVLLVALAISFGFPFQAKASELGLYLAPKALFSYQNLTDAQAKGRADLDGYALVGSDKSDSTGGLAFAIGYDFYANTKLPIRTEIEYAARTRSEARWSEPLFGGDRLTTSFKNDVHSLFWNLYTDIPNQSRFIPYFGMGLGLSRISTRGSMAYDDGEDGSSNVTASDSHVKNNFAWHIGAGVAYRITKKTYRRDSRKGLSLDLGYRYTDFGEAAIEPAAMVDGERIALDGEASLSAHEVLLGLRFTF